MLPTVKDELQVVQDLDPVSGEENGHNSLGRSGRKTHRNEPAHFLVHSDLFFHA